MNSPRITSTTMLQVLAAAVALSIAGWFAVTYAFDSGAALVLQPVYAQGNALQAFNAVAPQGKPVEQIVQEPPAQVPQQAQPSQLTQHPVQPATQQQHPDAGLVYVVQQGDMLYRIACMHNVSIFDLRHVNHLNTDNVASGQTLTIPQPLVQKNDCHAVGDNDTLYSIAQRYNTTIDRIIDSNPLKADRLRGGTILFKEFLYVPRG